MLESAGYDSAIVGKWHLGLEAPNRPTDRGFDFFHGYLGDMMDDYYKHRRHGINYMRKGTREIDPQGHATDLFTEWACDYLRGRTQKKAPFFLYLAYNAPHTPIQPPDDWVEKVLKRETGIDPARARLVALIEHMDDGIGKVMETISKTGLAANTLVIFTSDNGGQLSVKANNGPLRDGKQSMYEGGLKVPACAVWPEKIAPGSHSDRIAITMDLFATICDMAGVSVKHTIEGRSILPTLLGQSQPEEDRDLFFHRREGGERYGGLTIHAIRRGDWKLLQDSPFAPMELYNLRQDPAEQNDLANDNRKVYREMLSALRVQIQRGGAVPWQRPARRDVK
jgi:arylsulfatase A-like enzyme